ncbi:heat shock factor family protein [Skeletonema marinoi]|uniref:Heat shock factor family protein n=1 Tax=Skeletonema marinoi TaxID=267567 RepID=A0AAD8XWG4_9STRA|nr:heat shock factor family protein [Skeletonema marinoi]
MRTSVNEHRVSRFKNTLVWYSDAIAGHLLSLQYITIPEKLTNMLAYRCTTSTNNSVTQPAIAFNSIYNKSTNLAMTNTAPIGRSPSRSNSSTGLARSDKFPSKLYEMLESVDCLGLSHTASWLPHGRSFQVKDPTQFMDLVVPKFFKATKYRSFQRQLNLWGFSRIVKGQEHACWHHEYFVRGRPELLSKISRTRVKVKGREATQAADTRKEAPMQVPSEDSSEGASDYNEDDDVYEEDASVTNSTRHFSYTSSYVAPAPFKDEVFDEKLNAKFFERDPSQNRNSGFANVDQMCLEPLPIDSAGILDSPGNRNNCDLAEFGQLLGRFQEEEERAEASRRPGG